MISTKNFISPNYYSDITKNQITTQKTLLGQDLSSIAMNANYLAMNGTQQIPLANPNLSLLAYPILTTSFISSIKAMTFVNANNNERVWDLQLFNIFDITGSTSISASLFIEGTVGISSSSIGYWQNPNGYRNKLNITQSLNYTGSSLIKEDTKISFIYNAADLSDYYLTGIDYISMYTSPQRYVNPTIFTNQQAVDIQSVKENQPIYSSVSNQNSSIAGIANTIKFVKEQVVSTKGILSLFSPYEINGTKSDYSEIISTTISSSYESWLPTLPVFATSLNSTSTSKLIDWYAFVGVDDAAQPGKFLLSSSFGTTSSIFSNTVPAWISGSILVEAEDFSFESTINPIRLNQYHENFAIGLNKTVSTDSSAVFVWTLQLFEGNN